MSSVDVSSGEIHVGCVAVSNGGVGCVAVSNGGVGRVVVSNGRVGRVAVSNGGVGRVTVSNGGVGCKLLLRLIDSSMSLSLVKIEFCVTCICFCAIYFNYIHA